MKTLALVALLAAPSFAQTAAPAPASDSISALYAWVQTQQAQVGTSLDLHATKYAVTWWDAVSYGSKGINVGLASAKDYVDLGPGMAAANARRTRYGQAIPIHIGNIWNSFASSLPSGLASHLNLATLPNVTLSPLFMFPDHKSINKWTWSDDFQVAVGYRFGGAN